MVVRIACSASEIALSMADGTYSTEVPLLLEAVPVGAERVLDGVFLLCVTLPGFRPDPPPSPPAAEAKSVYRTSISRAVINCRTVSATE